MRVISNTCRHSALDISLAKLSNCGLCDADLLAFIRPTKTHGIKSNESVDYVREPENSGC